jgi:hypothetical protein
MPTISIREKKGRNCSPPKPPPTSSRGRRPPPLSDLLFLVRWLWHGGESRQHGCVSGGATPRTPPHVGRSQVKGFRRCMHGGCRAASPTRPRGPIAGSLCNWDRRRGRQSFVYCIACWDVRWGSGRRRGRPSSSSASLAPLRRRGLHDVIPDLGVGRTRLLALYALHLDGVLGLRIVFSNMAEEVLPATKSGSSFGCCPWWLFAICLGYFWTWSSSQVSYALHMLSNL